MVTSLPDKATSMTRCPSLVVTAIGDAVETGADAAVLDEGEGAAAAGAAGSSAGCPQAAISSTSTKDFHISLRFLFVVEVFDDGRLQLRAERTEGVVIHRGGGHDRAAAVVGVVCVETNRVLAVDEEVGHAACVRGQQRDAERRGLEDDVRQSVV